MPFFLSLLTPQALSILNGEMRTHALIIEGIIFLLMTVGFILFRHRMVKILCAFGSECCLWLACRELFGKGALLSQIMNWVTAAAVLGVMIAIVNRINWGNLRGEDKKK